MVIRPIRWSGGTAVRIGYKLGNIFRAKFLFTMNADGQHSPTEMANLVDSLKEGTSDLLIGSRSLGFGKNHSWLRKIGVVLFLLTVSVLMHRKITDCASDYRAFRLSSPCFLNL